MATSAQLPRKQNFADWFREFLHQELKPFPGRGAIVARMVIAATLSMLIIMTFRIPFGAVGITCAFILSRENLVSTARSGFYFLLAFAIWTLLIPIGAHMFASIPSTHFLWEGVSVFVCFFLLSTLASFPLTTGVVVVGTATLSIWYLPGPAEQNVELTLWQILATFIGAIVTIAVETVFRYCDIADPLRDGIVNRLQAVEAMLRAYSTGTPVPDAIKRTLTQYAVTGASALRRQVARNDLSGFERSKMSALVSLTGRTIDFSAALVSGYQEPQPYVRDHAGRLLSRVVEIRHFFESGIAPARWQAALDPNVSTPLFSELESVFALMSSVFDTSTSIDPRLQILERPQSANRIFVEDAFKNPAHVRFALVGTTASMLCYIIYVGLNWPGISTAVTTCLLTALSNIGSSRQKQTLRIAGAMIGGFVFGLGSQIFVLPYIDSITGFTLLFASVTAISAYVATSSTRLSYAGLQMAFAFYLINVNEFSISLDLTVGRDRAVGVILGITMMWLVFERLYPKAAGDQMVRLFIRTVRLISEFVSESDIGAVPEAVIRIRKQRDQVYRYFGEVNAEADAIPFETGKMRAGHMAARDRIRRWQATLRTLYLMEIPLLQFRLYGNADSISPGFRQIEARFLEDCAQSLAHIADSLESQVENRSYPHPPHRPLQDALTEIVSEQHTPISTHEEGLINLTRLISQLVDELEEEAVKTPIFSFE